MISPHAHRSFRFPETNTENKSEQTIKTVQHQDFAPVWDERFF